MNQKYIPTTESALTLQTLHQTGSKIIYFCTSVNINYTKENNESTADSYLYITQQFFLPSVCL